MKLTRDELKRASIVQECVTGRLPNGQAAERLGLTARQLRRLKQRFRAGGAAAFASQKRGQRSNNQLARDTKVRALELLRGPYAGWGPVLAHEKLIELHHLLLSRETVRQLLIQERLWNPHRPKKAVIHQLRERRAQRGELVQLDGSPFDWFEGRAPACTLLVFVDDATGELLQLFFTEAESTHSYFQATELYLQEQGRPRAFYSDKFGVFRINHPTDRNGDGTTQFGRAMSELDIQVLCADTPQAKGRVERMHQTLQDRLVKEMRLRGISDQATANAYLPEFRRDYNRRFARVPRDPQDAHRPLRVTDDLARILALREIRTLSKNLTLNYQRVVYQIQTGRPSYALRQAKVEVRERWDGTVQIWYRGQPLAYSIYREPPRQAELCSSKELNPKLDAQAASGKKRKAPSPSPEHPWRRFKYGRSEIQA